MNGLSLKSKMTCFIYKCCKVNVSLKRCVLTGMSLRKVINTNKDNYTTQRRMVPHPTLALGKSLILSIKNNFINNCVHNSLTVFERRKEYITTSMFTLGKNPFSKTRR